MPAKHTASKEEFVQCTHMVPNSATHVGGCSYPSEHPECILREDHEGEHLGRYQSTGQYIEWQREMGECDCTPQEQLDGECECFYYSFPKTKAVMRRLKKDGPRA